ncbi:hypothetical protein, partial [Gardnerella leopoldii]|uniref:hypothetical protein n=1 Tax=Gardnerella leopoldii TaxID=2792978 RepID=UPI003970530B
IFRKNVNFKVFKDFSQKTLRKLLNTPPTSRKTVAKPPFPRDTPTTHFYMTRAAVPLRSYKNNTASWPITQQIKKIGRRINASPAKLSFSNRI